MRAGGPDIVSGMSPPLLADMLREAARVDPDREAYVHEDRRVTFAWLDRAADGFAATLVDLGVQPGDVVGLLLPTSMKFAACFLGAARAGAITSAVPLHLRPAEQAGIIERAAPRVTVLGDGVELPVGVDPGRLLPVGALKEAFAATPRASSPRLSPSDPVCVVWSSDRPDGAPHGVIHDHEALAAISAAVAGLAACHDRLLLLVPFTHIGYLGFVHAFLAHRTTVLLGPRPWSATECLRIADAARATVMHGTPAQWAEMLALVDRAGGSLPALRIAVTGPETPVELLTRLRERARCPVVTVHAGTQTDVISPAWVVHADEVVAHTAEGAPR